MGICQSEDMALPTERRDETRCADAAEDWGHAVFPFLELGGQVECGFERGGGGLGGGSDGVNLAGDFAEDAG